MTTTPPRPHYPGPTIVACTYCGRGADTWCADGRGNRRTFVHAARRAAYAAWLNANRKEVK